MMMTEAPARATLLALAAATLCLACRNEQPTSAPTDASTDRAPASAGEPATRGLEAGLATIDGADLARHVELLASDAFEGRFPGSAGETKTISYLSAQLARFGVEPGNGESFLQEVPLVATKPGARRFAVRRASARRGARALSVPDDILFGVERYRDRLTVSGRELVFAGHGVVAPEHGWDDYGSTDVRGKIVLVLRGEPGEDAAAPDPKFFKGRALTHHGTFQAKKDAARERGALGVISIHDAATVPWKTIAGGANKTSYRLADSRAAVDLQGIMRGAVVDELLTLAGQDPASLRAAAERAEFVAVPLGLEVDAEVETAAEPVRSHNVVGILPGSERPDEYVLYTAHWDHVGVDAGREGDRVFNGAIDNATGTAALLELAEAFASLEPRPARSIVFLATTAEEQGLLGAKHYVERPLYPLAQTAGVINMDALFPFGETRGMTVVALGSSELEEYMARAAPAVDRALFPDPAPELGAFFRSDHYPFASRGVPALFAVGGPSQDPSAGETVDLQRYVDYIQHGYHQTGDEYDAKTWDMGGIVQDVIMYFHTGYHVAVDERFPNWYPHSEFRPLRDAMRSGAG